MIVEVFVRKVSEQNLENDFISIFLILYIVLFTFSLNVLNEGKKQRLFSIDKWFSILKNENFNRNSPQKNYIVYLMTFLFVWLLFVILLLNTELVKSLLAPTFSSFYSYFYFWAIGVVFFFLKSFLILFIGNVFAVSKSAYYYSMIDFKVWLFYSLIIYPIVGMQIYDSFSFSNSLILGVFFVPLILVLVKKILFLFSVKEYSWFVKLLYLCVFEILVYFICIKLIVSNL